MFQAILSGPAEAPPNASPGIGTAQVTLDLDLVTMRVEVQFSGLVGTTTASHIHAPTALAGTGTAAVATQLPTFTGFPSGVTSGAYDQTFDLTLASSYNPSFITASGGTVSGALNALIFALEDGKAYLNVHTTAFPGGEIRGFLTPVPVPEPSSSGLILAGAIGLGLWRCFRRVGVPTRL
jgi:hypothetical protein